MPWRIRKIFTLAIPFAWICFSSPVAIGEGPRVYLDAANLGVSAMFSAVNVRGGVQIPLLGPWSYVIEAQAYATQPSDVLVAQADATVLFRFQPWRALGLYFGAGPGLGVYDSSALPSFGGTAASQQIGVKAYVIAETGWTIGFGSFPIFFEPFARGFGAGGWDGRSGSKVTGLEQWSMFGGADVGFRVGWRF